MRFSFFRLLLFLLTGLVFLILAIELWMLYSMIFVLYSGIALLLLLISMTTLVMKKRSLTYNHLLLMLIVLIANFGAGFVIEKQQEVTLKRAGRVVEQIERFKSEKGMLPEKLELIVPEYLDSDDIFTAYGLGISRQPFAYQLYSHQEEDQSKEKRYFKLSFEKGLTKACRYTSHLKKWENTP